MSGEISLTMPEIFHLNFRNLFPEPDDQNCVRMFELGARAFNSLTILALGGAVAQISSGGSNWGARGPFPEEHFVHLIQA